MKFYTEYCDKQNFPRISESSFICFLNSCSGDFTGGPVAKNLPASAGGWGLIPDQGTRSHMPHLKTLHTETKT